MIGEPERNAEESQERHPPPSPRKPVVVRVFRALKRQINRTRRRREKNETTHQINERMMAQWTRRVGWFTGALVVVSVVTACIFWRQLNVMQRQLDDAEIQEAASITIKNLTAAGFPDNIVISYDISNHGRTRADQVNVHLAHGTMRPEEEFKIFTGEFGVGFTSPNVNGLSIDPSDPPRHISFPFGSLPLIPQGMPPEILAKLPSKEDFVSGRVLAYFAVLGAYLDVFGKVHHVTDCVIFHRGNGFEPCTANHGRHN
jgi:hypothetical protein